CRPLAGNLAMPPKIMRLPASGRHYRIAHALLRQAMPGGRERVAAAVLRRAAKGRNTVVPAAGRQPGNAT
ncbi:hypothetical protein, partial [Stenotrophomonas maltophilia]|uniref:hypothetical protein n=1 Tax=Stenotrophomonas maltophilia TaxID=40324 RepID=UPI001955F248